VCSSDLREVRASVEIYLDNAATTPPLPEVIEAVNHVLKTAWGNPSSVHTKGVEAERIVAEARRNVAAALRARPDEILFTSGGTEANALAIKGAARARAGRYRHVITAATEHPSVFNAVESLEDEGFSVTVLPVDSEGRVRVEDVLAALRDDTGLVTLMWVNNEVGTLHPVAEIARAVKERRPDVWLHFDAVQAFGKVPIRLDEVPADLLTVSGHKIHGPKGVGALFVREGVRLAPLFGPGTQEKGIRPGTENVPGIAGFGVAAKAAADMPAEMEKTRALKNLLWERIAAAVPFAVRNGPADEAASAPHILSVSFPGLRGEVLVHALAERGVYVSTGSACSSRRRKGQRVLKALGLDERRAEGTIRLSLSRLTTAEEVEEAARRIAAVALELREFARA